MSDQVWRIDDLPDAVQCTEIPYNGEKHFAMAWMVSEGKGSKAFRVKMTLLDPEDCQIVYRDLGRFLRGETLEEEEG